MGIILFLISNNGTKDVKLYGKETRGGYCYDEKFPSIISLFLFAAAFDSILFAKIYILYSTDWTV